MNPIILASVQSATVFSIIGFITVVLIAFVLIGGICQFFLSTLPNFLGNLPRKSDLHEVETEIRRLREHSNCVEARINGRLLHIEDAINRRQ